MTVPELLLRADNGKMAYRLRCRFRVNAHPNERFLEKAKHAAAEQFITDMRKQGWDYLEKYDFKMTGPYSPVNTTSLPKRSQQQKWDLPSRDIMAAAQAGYRLPQPKDSYIRPVPLIAETDEWEFELAAVFVRDTILTELAPERKGTL